MNFNLTINLGPETLGVLRELIGSLDALVPSAQPAVPRELALTGFPAVDPSLLPGTQDGVTTDAAMAFGAVPLAPPAPSTADAPASPSAPVAPPAGLPLPPTAAQPPAAPSPAPVAPSAPAASVNPAGGVDLDTDGFPWDARIHGSTKTKNADGRWRAKKGLNDAALVDRVKAELRQMMAIPSGQQGSVTVTPAGSGAHAIVITPPSGETSAAAAFGAAPLAPQAPPAAPPAAVPVPTPSVGPAATASAPAGADPTTLAELMQRITKTPEIKPADVLGACTEFSLPSVAALMQRPDMVPYVYQSLRAKFPALA